jgi:hypothetical protein
MIGIGCPGRGMTSEVNIAHTYMRLLLCTVSKVYVTASELLML